ncbi:MAG: FAD-binding oxidoreductase [Trichocoleus desertorum ATA4-8-CV12]|jgi:glycolate oxidase FAD binding subunit|nr:FAD-binding oxidoreductase [Trichocoleus desertorum ATA4-8-CV12]
MAAIPASDANAPNTNAPVEELTSIVGAENIRSYGELSAQWQQAIAQAVTPGTRISGVIYPGTQAELAEVVRRANEHQWGILPCGNGSKLHWGGLGSEINWVVSTQRLNRLIEHAVGDLTVTAEAGMKWVDLQTCLAKAGQFLAIDPAYPETATLGGIVATSDAGSLRQRYGGVRDMLLGLSLIRADGATAKAGGRVVKNVAGYDLMKLMTGSYGTLGILSQVTFRLYPLQVGSQTVVLTGQAEAIAQATQTLLHSALTPTALDVLSTSTVTSLQMGKGMGLVIRFQSMASSVQVQADRVLALGETLGLASHLYADTDEKQLWQQLGAPTLDTSEPIICKIGIRPAEAIAALVETEVMTSQTAPGLIHASSGLGKLYLDSQATSAAILLELRALYQAKGGFLSVLQAPITVKQEFEVWGYAGSGLDLMRRLKHQFDPKNLLSPHRFVGGI